jgi:hypothetical protein
MASTIETLRYANNVLTNSLNDNALRFHVETKLADFSLPSAVITYETKLTDTHNAMNTGNGIFTAPFSGTFGFLFYAQFWCDAKDRYLYVDHNGARSKIFLCDTDYIDSSISYSSSSNVYFALNLKQDDKVGIFTGSVSLWSKPFPAKFTGFLLQKN